VDINTDRLEFARQSGIAVSDTENAVQSGQGFSRGRGFDVVLICADTPANDPVELAGQMVRDRGHVIVVGAVGLTLPRKLYFDKEVHFQVSRSYGPGRYDPQYEENGQDYPAGYVRWTEGRNLEAFVDLLANDQINTRRLITHRFPIDEAAQAYDLITGKKKEDFTAVLLTYPSTSDSSDSIRIFEKPAMSQTANAGEAHRMGVLGSGNYATVVFLPNLKRMKSVRMAGIASGSGATASHAARKFGFQYSTADELEIINDESTSMVAILTRHQHHARQIITSLKAGKHVFCEKPMAISVEECENVILEANKAGSSCLMVGFNRRFAPLVLKLINFLEDRSEPLFMQYRVNAGFLPATHWLHDPAQGGGRLIGEACHFIDLMTFITGSIPKTVHGTSIPDIGRYQQDNFSLSITFQDGSLGILNYLANGDKSYPKEYLEVFGGGDIAILDDYRSLSLVKNGLKKVHQLKLHQDKGHTRALETFIAAVKQPGRPPITYEELWAVAQASFCAVESLNSNVPVNIPPYPIMHYST
jgi:predicted dehydrogenase